MERVTSHDSGVTSAARSRRYLPLDTLRACAFGAVFIEHVFGGPLVWSGVDLFFVLSGYLITGILLRGLGRPRYFSGFYKRRTIRIFPPYYLAILVAVLLLPATHVAAPWCAGFLGNVFFAIHGTTNPLAPLWSLAVEEQFYLLWPLALVLTPERRRRQLFAALLVVAPCVRALFVAVGLPYGAYTLLPSRMDELVAGAFIADVRFCDGDAGLRTLRPWALRLVLPGAVLFAGSAELGGHLGYLYSVGAYEGTWIFYSCILVFVLTLRPGAVMRLLSLRPIVYVGLISYTLYLIHRPLIVWLGEHSLASVKLAVVALAATLAYAACSWRLLERPLLRRVTSPTFRTPEEIAEGPAVAP